MERKTIPCRCGKNAEICHLSVFDIFLIKCECGRRTGADTEDRAIHFWNQSIEEDGDTDITQPLADAEC